MSSHCIYEAYVKNLRQTGCINVVPSSVANLVNQTSISIENHDRSSVKIFEELIYTIILHHCVTYGEMVGQVPKYVNMIMGTSKKTEINFANMPQTLLQIIYSIVMDIRKL